jgi:hypothetical protein
MGWEGDGIGGHNYCVLGVSGVIVDPDIHAYVLHDFLITMQCTVLRNYFKTAVWQPVAGVIYPAKTNQSLFKLGPEMMRLRALPLTRFSREISRSSNPRDLPRIQVAS